MYWSQKKATCLQTLLILPRKILLLIYFPLLVLLCKHIIDQSTYLNIFHLEKCSRLWYYFVLLPKNVSPINDYHSIPIYYFHCVYYYQIHWSHVLIHLDPSPLIISSLLTNNKRLHYPFETLGQKDIHYRILSTKES